MSLPWIRLVLAISLDGRLAPSNGGKANLGGEGDRRVLEEALAWSDATLMGSGTLKIHKNTCLIHDSKLIRERHTQGRSTQPISLIISKQSSFPQTWQFFRQPITRWLLIPKAKTQIFTSEGFEQQIVMQDNWSGTLHDLNQKGCSRIVLLGGIQLITSLLLEDKVDELQLTFTPRLLGGKYTWTASGKNSLPIELTKSDAWHLKGIEELGKNEVMIKYLRKRS
ncbi:MULTISPECIES: RibD family protein [Prochlorococcus]|uniref:Pyrimidine reductase n=1 Tax=Prochlorococcus marinus (strain SARG / CCMP1375 / SS120) TaxID=167539 RepID=Q7VE87_PROMA|nr:MULTISPECIES: RibD family protein [Prochlorococcus]AAP99172.1 Pyrimidine reductase [Prochlorococcus marinus subsp. marinus str. CCMP1375]KGG11558.1 5-amino-6-(5-phosphoribosylamino)uracil reductase [Prochlorococcus marinus str. LG]KGG18488.1 5-amino-6-(5-phosphoribosylamino)uracil reductase [Prochlorococcus marinus str. SS2]KGG22761.1 5-amino-6-(5-phosphoribosylamino)uracil reductase [Prochlorococcus marinus str. SS35]KGG32637.1 5-amino-6-(5-phosphoribosylamino)uracil reductase [Prochloroco